MEYTTRQRGFPPFFLTGFPQMKRNDLLAWCARKTTDYIDALQSGSTLLELVQFLLIRHDREETLAYYYEKFSTDMDAPQQDEVKYGQKL